MHPRDRITAAAGAAVTLPFLPSLAEALRLTHANGLQTYAPAVPLVAGYLAWQARSTPVEHPPARAPFWCAIAALTLGGVAIALAPFAVEPAAAAALRVLGWIALLAGAFAALPGGAGIYRWRLPLIVLTFLAPLPQAAIAACEEVFQYASAETARALFELHGTPVHLAGLTLNLPGISLWVAPECSGLRSSLFLLLLTIVAAGTLLRSTPTRLILVAAVLPIAIARNGLRIFVIGAMCARQGPAALESPLHRQGGPVFFVLSVIPWALLLAVLYRREASARSASAPLSQP